jgi:hypothetical protein
MNDRGKICYVCNARKRDEDNPCPRCDGWGKVYTQRESMLMDMKITEIEALEKLAISYLSTRPSPMGAR